ncbi:MAG TPA: phosphoribosylformylglycinamidine synthase subunit PurL [Polyangia bacterium]|jgi:phosphoribosylformylglycinamidine synthase
MKRTGHGLPEVVDLGRDRAATEAYTKVAADHGFSAAEWRRVHDILGRAPTITEVGVFSVMWSEHCSYKSSRIYLKNLPTTGPRVIEGPGENAGVVDIDDGQAAIFKMESHNHPSYIEPFQGAATGVGGILRDVFTMGARPIGAMNALRFGRPEHPRTHYLVEGVVAGIGSYGNCFGVPTVGGDVAFDECYDGNILVNAFTLGLASADRIFKGTAAGPGNPVIYVGAKTGRDGIHGATMASAEFGEETEHKRPTVQVGDPFTEKLLLEACLELMAQDVIVGIQDMGAAGLTSSSVEMASRAGNGMDLDLDRVPRRETGMTPYEIMLSESQERMLMVVGKGREVDAIRVFEKWDLDAVVVGTVTESGRMRISFGGQLVADMPVQPLTEGLKYDRPRARPDWQDELTSPAQVAVAGPADLGAAVLAVVGSPTVASKEWVYRQYDHQVRDLTVVRPGSDAAVIRVTAPDGREKGLALTVDCNSRFCYLDPYEGGRMAVCEAARNLVCSGAEPLAITDCLNFGNPEKPEIMWQFAECLRGLSDACRALATPVVSGNVSFYNETNGRGIYPTPMIGMIGLMPRVADHVTQWLKGEGDLIALLGRNTAEIGGSEYLKVLHGRVAGPAPRLDMALEQAVQRACLALARAGLLRSAHDLAEGGLAAALAECCVSGPAPIGCSVRLADGLRPDHLLFGEAPSRIVISLDPARQDEVARVAAAAGAPLAFVGVAGGRRFKVEAAGTVVDLPLADVDTAWREGFRRVVE